MMRRIPFVQLADDLDVDVADLLVIGNTCRLPFTRGADGFHYVREIDLPAWHCNVDAIFGDRVEPSKESN